MGLCMEHSTTGGRISALQTKPTLLILNPRMVFPRVGDSFLAYLAGGPPSLS